MLKVFVSLLLFCFRLPVERYRIQCDVFQGMWLVLCELSKRLEAYFKKNKVKPACVWN